MCAMPATNVAECRADSTAGNLNGGWFDAALGGTDYSQQTAAQVNASDGTSNASTNFNSAAVTFTSVMVGNCLHLVSGTNGTPGWYSIRAFVDANNVTLDRNCSTGAMTNGVFYVGGAMSLNSTLDDDFFESAVAGNKIYLRGAAGGLSLGESVSIAAAGGASQPIIVEGYNATRGDAPTGSTRPTLACGASSLVFGANWDIYYTIFTTTSTTGAQIGNAGKLVGCKATNSSTTAARPGFTAAGADIWAFNNEGISYRGIALSVGNLSGTVYGNNIHSSNVGIGGTSGTNVGAIHRNIVESCVTAAIQFTGAKAGGLSIIGNTLYGSVNTTGIGVDLATGCTDIRVVNNIIYGFVTGVNHADTQTVGFDDYNCYNNNDADVSAAGQWQKGPHDVTTAPAFTGAGQVTGTAGAFTAGNDRLVDTSKNFTSLGVVANQDHIYIVSGTGVTAGIYAITAIQTTTNPNDTLILTPAPGTNVTADKTYQITLHTGGNAFLPTGAL